MRQAQLEAMKGELSALFGGYSFPGFSLAVGRAGAVLDAAAEGYACPARKQAMMPTTLIRLGSVSKVFTTAAILRLKQDGLLGLDQTLRKYFPYCEDFRNGPVDDRVLDITVKQILNYSSGLPMDFDCASYAKNDKTLNLYYDHEYCNYRSVCAYLYNCKLLHDPGKSESYSTIGFLVLGRIIEQLSGMTYYQFLSEKVLRPAQINSIVLGHSNGSRTTPAEATYFNIDNLRSGRPTEEIAFNFDNVTKHIECRDAAGGLVGSSVALINAMMSLYEVSGAEIFDCATRRDLVDSPSPVGAPETYVGLGWWIRRTPGFESERRTDPLYGIRLYHSGRSSGAVSFLFRGENGIWTAVQANCGVSGNDWPSFQSAVYAIISSRIRDQGGLP
jgi:CubicO group peptidase (beta-lactamase class C family)